MPTNALDLDPTLILGRLLERGPMSKKLNRSTRWLIRREAEGLPVIKAGRARLYDQAAVLAWLLSREATSSTRKVGRPRKHAIAS